MVRSLGYWTYEVCLGEEVRQFHSIVRGIDRHEVTSLGKLEGTASNALGAQQRYVGGGVCVPSGHERETTVTIGCGADRLADVNEPLPCRYEMSVQLRSACAAA